VALSPSLIAGDTYDRDAAFGTPPPTFLKSFDNSDIPGLTRNNARSKVREIQPKEKTKMLVKQVTRA